MQVTRKNFNKLKAAEKKRYVEAVLKMQDATGEPYKKFVEWHRAANDEPFAHRNIAFFAWHRVFLYEFEAELIAADIRNGKDGNIGIPYWDWTVDRSRTPSDGSGALWRDDFMGSTGDPSNELKVTSGPFRVGKWKVFSEDPSIPEGAPPGPLVEDFLRRNVGNKDSKGSIFLGPNDRRAFFALADSDDVEYALSQKVFDSGNFRFDRTNPGPIGSANNPESFRSVTEGWVRRPNPASPSDRLQGVSCHNVAHVWVGGSMGPTTSPNDPIFFLNHANVDRLWAIWQRRRLSSSGDTLAAQYPAKSLTDAAKAANPQVVGLADTLIPWDGTAGNSVWRTQDVINHQRTQKGATGHTYKYDDDPCTPQGQR